MHLRELREKAGLTQAGLADMAGIQQATISRLESGLSRAPSLPNARKLVLALRKAGIKGLTVDKAFPPEEETAA